MSEVNDYAAALYARRNEAAVVPPATVDVKDWEPAPKECHQNVTDFCESFPDHKPISGWLLLDPGDGAAYVTFLAHSVVEAADGRLHDITPNPTGRVYPFIRALENRAEFAAFVERNGGILYVHLR